MLTRSPLLSCIRIHTLAVMAGACMLLAGCAPEALSTLSHQTSPEDGIGAAVYQLQAGDTVALRVFGEDDLSGTFRIGDDGHVSLPLLGLVPLSGMTLREAEIKIEALFKDGYLRNPDLALEIAEVSPVYILGEVGEPGQYAFTEGLTVLGAAAMAEGFTYRAHKSDVEVLRRDDGTLSKKRLDIDAPIQPGDIIYVRERFF